MCDKNKFYLTEEDLVLILAQAFVQRRNLMSSIREGETMPKMHVAVHGRGKSAPILIHSDRGAWEGSKHQALEKASAALRHSSNQSAMTTKALSYLVKTGRKPSEGIVHLPGGVPLYKSYDGEPVLVGSLGISGDAPEIDEAIALSAAKGFEAPVSIRGETILNIPYEAMSDLKIIPDRKLPPLSKSVSTLPKLGEFS